MSEFPPKRLRRRVNGPAHKPFLQWPSVLQEIDDEIRRRKLSLKSVMESAGLQDSLLRKARKNGYVPSLRSICRIAHVLGLELTVRPLVEKKGEEK